MDAPKFANVIVHSGQQMAYNEEPADTAQSFARNTGCLSGKFRSTMLIEI